MNNQLPQNPNPLPTPTLPTGSTNPTTATPPTSSPTATTTGGGLNYSPPAESGGGTHYGDTGGFIPPGYQPPGTGGGGNAGNPNANFGQPIYPWLMPYGGQFTAPMSPYEQNALNSFQDFVNGGMGMNSSRDYLGNVLSGQYVDLNRNPFLQQIQQAMQGMKDYNDQQAIARLQSNAAAGGSALSGALIGGESDYMRNSNNTFQQLMGNLMNENYARERGFQTMVPGQMGSIASLMQGGLGNLMSMGAIPRQLQQNDFNSQYQDWLRQVGGMRDMFQYPDTLTQQLLYGGGFRGQTPNQYGNSTADMLAGLLGNSGIDWQSAGSGILDWLGGLFGGGGTQADTGGNTAQTYDGTPLGYDGPMGYGDANYYNNALTQAQNAFATQQANAAKGPNTTLPAILGLLMQLFGRKQQQQKNTSGFKPGLGGGGGNAPPPKAQGPGGPGYGGASMDSHDIPGPAMGGGNTYDLGNMTATSPYGYSFPIGPGTDFTENTSFYQTDPSLPNIPFSNLGPEGPSNPWDIFPDQGMNGNGNDPFSGEALGPAPDPYAVGNDYGSDFGGNVDYGNFGSSDFGGGGDEFF